MYPTQNALSDTRVSVERDVMKAVFISDAHLKKQTDERYLRLLRFISGVKEGRIRSFVDSEDLPDEKTAIDDLYIVGDFFDFWFSEPHRIYPDFQVMISELIDLQKTGVRIHFFEGNHDFFLKDYFHDVLGMDVIEEWAVIEPDERRILVSHGDTSDPSDRLFLLFRKMLRSRAFYRIQSLLPVSWRWSIAAASSNLSKEINGDKHEILFEKMLSFASEKLKEHYDAVVLGHCHKPMIRSFDVNGGRKTFVTLGDWIRYYSFLYYEDGRFYLSQFNRP
jgi:UDP-2,3-diacylglucosamine hydrolase